MKPSDLFESSVLHFRSFPQIDPSFYWAEERVNPKNEKQGPCHPMTPGKTNASTGQKDEHLQRSKWTPLDAEHRELVEPRSMKWLGSTSHFFQVAEVSSPPDGGELGETYGKIPIIHWNVGWYNLLAFWVSHFRQSDIHTYMHACMHASIHPFIHAHSHTHTRTYTHIHIHIHMHLHIHIHTYTYIHIHIRTYAYI